jgi:hypothetical protein
MFVACTINVLDLKENEPTGKAESRGRPAGGHSLGLGLAQEASVRLNFGLEVLRQAGATPSAARCAAVIVQLLKQWSGSKVVPAAPQGTQEHCLEHAIRSPLSRQRLRSAEMSPESVSLEHPAGMGQVDQNFRSDVPPHSHLLPLASGDGNNEFQLQAPLNVSKPQGHGQVPNSAPSFPAPSETMFQYNGEASAPSIATHEDPYANQNLLNFVNTGIETPMRWLPDNIDDDGSWMLMTDFGGGFPDV